MNEMSRRKALVTAAATGAAVALGGGASHAAAKDMGERLLAPFQTVAGKNLWEVVREIVGSPGGAFADKLSSQVCFDSPFGQICLDVDYAEALAHKSDLQKIELQSTVEALLASAKLRGACTTVCSFGVCVTHCW